MSNLTHYQKYREAHLQQRRRYYYRHREECLEYHRQHYRKNRERILARKRKHRQEHHDEILQKQKEYRERNKIKIRAHNLASSIPLGHQCSLCGSTENLERHHPDYSKPLEIVTLCESCHRRIHRSVVA